jgi:NAD(P)H dehydrogenase (quinone)
MNILIVLAHPELKSFSGAMADTAKRTLEAAGHTVTFSDLYRMGFNSVSDRHNFQLG